MSLNRLSLASAGSILVLTLFTGCQSIEDGFRYGFGFDPNAPAYAAGSSTAGNRRITQTRTTNRRNYNYEASRDGTTGIYSDTDTDSSSSSGFKRARYKTTETTSAGTLIDRDENGNIVRTGSVSGDSTTYRNTDGTISSTVYRSPAGTDTERDASGQIVTSSYANPSGDTVTYRDGSGRILGTKYTSPAGNVTYRDASGRITGSDFR